MEISESGEPKALSAADILGAADRRVEAVEVPEWGGRVFVRSMTGGERDAFDQAGMGDPDEDGDEGGNRAYLTNYRARLAAATLCDADGKLLFTAHQVDSLGCKSSAALNRVVRVAQRLNGMTRDAVTREKKGSAGPPSGGSPTGSPSPPAGPPTG